MVLLQHVFCFVTVIKALDWKGFVSMLPKIRVAFAEKIFHNILTSSLEIFSLLTWHKSFFPFGKKQK